MLQPHAGGESDSCLVKLCRRQVAVTEDGTQEPRPELLSRVNRGNGASPVGVPQKMMAAANANRLESDPLEFADDFLAPKARQASHGSTVTR